MEARKSEVSLKAELTIENNAKTTLQSQFNEEVAAKTALQKNLMVIKTTLSTAQFTLKTTQTDRDAAMSNLENLRKVTERIQKECDARSSELDKLHKDTEKTIADLRKKLTDAEDKGKRAASDNASNRILLEQAKQAHAGEKDNVVKLLDCINEGSAFLEALLKGRPIPSAIPDADTVDFISHLDQTRLHFERLHKEIDDTRHELAQKSSALDEALKAKGDTEAFVIERRQFVTDKDRL
jgi:predicted phage tail protein